MKTTSQKQRNWYEPSIVFQWRQVPVISSLILLPGFAFNNDINATTLK